MSSVNYNYLLHHEITDDILQTVPDSALPSLRDLFKHDWPYAVQAHHFIEQMMQWKRKNLGSGVRITCPGGNWQDGTFVAILTVCSYKVFFFTLERSCERLSQALRNTRLIEWPKGPYICAVHDDHDEAVMNTLRQLGEIEYEIESTCWWLPKETAKAYKIKSPADGYISTLSPKHIPSINSIWPHKFPGSDIYLTNLITVNEGFGVFALSTNQLCSWIMRNDYLAIATLQTLPEHKRKGYAALLIQLLAKKTAEDGFDSITYIVRKNVVSQTLFKSLGFRLNNNVRWVQFKEVTGLINKSHL